MGRLSGTVAVVLAVLLTAAVPAGADLKSGVAAYNRGDYKAAFEEFSKLAEQGDARGEFNLGILYLTGRGVEADPKKAMELHERAAQKGLETAQHGLGVMHYQGQGVPRDYVKAAEWFRKAANGGYANSQFNLAVMYFNEQGLKRNDIEIVKWISMAANARFAPAEYRLGQMYEKGVIFGKDPKEALVWYARAAAHGFKDAPDAITRVSRGLDRPPPVETAAGKPDEAPSPAMAPVESAAAVDRAAARATEKAAEAPKPDMTATPKPDTPKTPEAPPRSALAEWRIQLAAFRSDDEARRAWTQVSGRAAAALGALEPIVARADLGTRGIYYRLQAGPVAGKSEAADLCRKLKEILPRQGCLPVRHRAD